MGAAQRVEHYEIAAYGTVREFAKILDEPRHASLLGETLNEEKETDQKLTDVSKEINTLAIEDGSGEERGRPNRGQKTSRRVA